MSISSLPSVIQTLVDFKTKPEDIILLPANSNPNAKQFVICITRDVTPEEEDLLNYYGKCLSYNHDVVNNIELSKITYDYLLVDLREGTDRLYLQKYVLENLDKVATVVNFHCPLLISGFIFLCLKNPLQALLFAEGLHLEIAQALRGENFWSYNPTLLTPAFLWTRQILDFIKELKNEKNEFFKVTRTFDAMILPTLNETVVGDQNEALYYIDSRDLPSSEIAISLNNLIMDNLFFPNSLSFY